MTPAAVAIITIVSLWVTIYAVMDIVSRRTHHLPRHKYAALSEPSKRLIAANIKLPVEWRVDETWLYNTLVGMDDRFTVEAVDRYYEAFRGDGFSFSWFGNTRSNPSKSMNQYFELKKEIDYLGDALDAMKRDERHARTEYAAESMDAIMNKLMTDRQLIIETNQEIKRLS